MVPFGPKDIIEKLNKTVIGQDEAKKIVANTLYLHFLGMQYKALNKKDRLPLNNNLLLLGPSGSGKTLLINEGIKAIQEITDTNIMPLCTIDCTNVTASGWVGVSLSDIFKEHKETYRLENVWQTSVIYLDEFDKLCLPLVSSGGTDHNKNLQYTLLKLLEHGSFFMDDPRSPQTIDTSDWLFVFSGNFAQLRKERDDNKKTIGFKSVDHEKLDEDLVKGLQKAGMATQLIGRIGAVTEITSLTEKDLTKILKEITIPEIKDFFEFIKQPVDLPDSVTSEIVKLAMKRKTGARGLKLALMDYLQDQISEQKVDWLGLYPHQPPIVESTSRVIITTKKPSDKYYTIEELDELFIDPGYKEDLEYPPEPVEGDEYGDHPDD